MMNSNEQKNDFLLEISESIDSIDSEFDINDDEQEYNPLFFGTTIKEFITGDWMSEKVFKNKDNNELWSDDKIDCIIIILNIVKEKIYRRGYDMEITIDNVNAWNSIIKIKDVESRGKYGLFYINDYEPSIHLMALFDSRREANIASCLIREDHELLFEFTGYSYIECPYLKIKKIADNDVFSNKMIWQWQENRHLCFNYYISEQNDREPQINNKGWLEKLSSKLNKECNILLSIEEIQEKCEDITKKCLLLP